MSSTSRLSRPRHLGVPHTQEDIRDSTMQLSSIPMRSPSSNQGSFIFPTSIAHTPTEALPSIPGSLPSTTGTEDNDAIDLSLSTPSAHSSQTTPRGSFQPSGLTLLLAQHLDASAPEAEEETTPTTHPADDSRSISTRSLAPQTTDRVDDGRPSERTPLLVDHDVEGSYFSYTLNGNGHPMAHNGQAHEPDAVSKRATRGTLAGWGYRAMHVASPKNLQDIGATAVRSLPAVLLGALLNILDGVSCAFFRVLCFFAMY